MDELTIGPFDKMLGITEKKHAECEVHGRYVSALMPKTSTWSGCPDCSRIAQSLAEQDEIRRENARRESERVRMLLGRAAIPERFSDKGFDNYQSETPNQRAVLEACRDYAEAFPQHLEDGRCMLLIGPPGTGKTHLGTAVATEVVRRHRLSAAYASVSEAVRRIKDNWVTRQHAESDLIAMYAKPSLLVLDEIGHGWGSDSELLLLFEIINARYQAKRPTILIGNITREEVRACVGDRVADRLNEAGCRVVRFSGESMRSKV